MKFLGVETWGNTTATKVWFGPKNPRACDAKDKIRGIRQLIEQGSRDPFVHAKAGELVQLLKPRDHLAEASTILRWVQSRIRYTFEKTETIQTARYTIEHGYGDCDDMVVVYCSLVESIGLPTQLEVLGKEVGTWPFKRWNWYHIYCRVGLPPKKPQRWFAAETTLPVPFGAEPIDLAKRVT